MDILKNIFTKLKNSVQVTTLLQENEDVCSDNNNNNENNENINNVEDGCYGCNNDNIFNKDSRNISRKSDEPVASHLLRSSKGFGTTGKAPGTASRVPLVDSGATSLSLETICRSHNNRNFVGNDVMPVVHSLSGDAKASRRKLAVAGNSANPLGLNHSHAVTKESRVEKVHFCEKNLRNCKDNEVDTARGKPTKRRPARRAGSNPRGCNEEEDVRRTGSNSLRAEEDGRRAGSNSLRAEEDGRRAGSNSIRAKEDGRHAGSNSLRAEEDSRRAGSNSLRAEEDSRRAGSTSRSSWADEGSFRAESTPRASWTEEDTYCDNKKTAAWFLGPKARCGGKKVCNVGF
jgi:hypothetical protein